MSQVISPAPLHSIPAPLGMAYVIRGGGHAGLPELHAGVKEVTGAPAQPVSIRRLGPATGEQASFATALREELARRSLCTHPNIVGVLDVLDDAEGVWVVLEQIDGVALSVLLALAQERRVRLPASVLGQIMVDVLCGLEEIHHRLLEAGSSTVAHRDISLNSIFVGLGGTSQLLDLGLARAAEKTGITQRTHLSDSLPYMSAEQLSGGYVGPASDTYSLSVLLWELLAQRELFRRSSAEETIQAIVNGPIPEDFSDAAAVGLSFLRPAVDRDMRRRFQFPSEMAAAIQKHLPPGSHAEVRRWVRSLAPGGALLLDGEIDSAAGVHFEEQTRADLPWVSSGLRPSARRPNAEESDEPTEKNSIAHLCDLLGGEYPVKRTKDRSGVGFKKPEPELSVPLNGDDEVTRPERLHEADAEPLPGAQAKYRAPQADQSSASPRITLPSAQRRRIITTRAQRLPAACPVPPTGPYIQPAEEQTTNEPNLWSLRADLLPEAAGLGEGRYAQLSAAARTRLGPRFYSAVRLPLLVVGGAFLGALIGLGAKLAMNTGGAAEEAVVVAPVAQLRVEPTLAPTDQTDTMNSTVTETFTRPTQGASERKVFTVDELPAAPATEDESPR